MAAGDPAANSVHSTSAAGTTAWVTSPSPDRKARPTEEELERRRQIVALALWCVNHGGFATAPGRNSRQLLSIDGIPFYTAS